MSAGAEPASKDERLHALDGLRGAAAVAVFFYHAVTYLPISDWWRTAIDATPLGPLCNGPGAVHVFFVLSGYVLALTLQNDTGAGRLPRYYVRRVFRIHPPYLAAVLLAFAASRSSAGDPPWVQLPAARLPTALAFPSMAFGLLPVGWSLYVEMAMSAVFPLLFGVARRVHPLLPLGIALLLLRDIDPRLAFLRFTIDFALGLTLRLEAERIGRAIRSLPPIAPIVAMAGGLVVLQLPLVGSTLGHRGLERGHSAGAVLCFAIAASLLLVATLHAPALQRFLAAPVARFFGRISYSFYLVHHTVLVVVMAQVASDSLLLVLAATLAAFAVSVALAELGWRAVEAPAIRVGRALIRTGGSLFVRASSP